MENDAGLRIQQGLPVKTLPDFSYEGARKRTAFYRSLRERLARIDPKGLTHEEWLSREILDGNLSAFTEGLPHFWDFFQLTPYSAPFRASLHPVFDELHLPDLQDRERYLDLLRQYARAVGQLRTNLETQRGKGILLPKAEIDTVVGLVRSFVRKPEESLFAVGSERLQKFYPEGAAAFQSRSEARRDHDEPRLGIARGRGGRQSLPGVGARAVGLGHYPGGQAAYQYVVSLHTTMTGLTPRAIHERGCRRSQGSMAGWRRSGKGSASRGISRRSASF